MTWRSTVAHHSRRCLLSGLGHARAAWGLLRYRLIPLSTVPFGYMRHHRQRVAAWPQGPIALGPRVAVFCHFDRLGAVRPDVLRYLAALRSADFDIAVVSNSGSLRPEALAGFKKVAAAVLVRRNVGLDFCAWREALEWLGLPRRETELVLLANDSVYGPLRPLAPLLARIDMNSADVWGLTDCQQIRFHLQSYFLAVGPAALRSEAWQRFWRGVRPLPSKRAMILRYESRLTQQLSDAGLRCRAIWPTDELPIPGSMRALDRLSINPTHDLWRQLLDASFPFIKRELLRNNALGVPNLSDWRQAVGDIDAGELAEIEQDLRRGATP